MAKENGNNNITLFTEKRYNIKNIKISSKNTTHTIMHMHKKIIFVVVKGCAELQINDDDFIFLHEGDTINIKQTTKYKIHNPGIIELEMICVQLGSYIEDDDIIVF